jgi:2-(1,2-epoxy-1,2-dihydrophenyl)acetyl-CoA isomerase
MGRTLDYTHVLLEIGDDHVGTITLNRPEKLNAFTPAMINGVLEAFAEVNRDDSVRVVVLSGAGRAFSAGADVAAWDAELQAGQDTVAGRRKGKERTNLLPTVIRTCRVPVIAKVRGYAMGMAMDIALSADLRVSAEDARWSMFYIHRGLVADDGGPWLLQRMIGFAKTAELIYFGDMITGKEGAEHWGFVNRAVPAEDLDATVDGWAKKIVSGAPIAMELVKRALLHAENQTLEQHMEQVSYYAEVVGSTDDIKEGMRAFVEKREPVFHGS